MHRDFRFGPSDRSRTSLRSPTPPRGFASLWRRHCWSSVYPGLPPPAPSAPGLSQASDGLLLQTAHLSCFIQTPPMGFKEHERFVAFLAVLTGPSWGQSRPGSQGSDMLTTRRRLHGSAALLPTTTSSCSRDARFAQCADVSLTESAASNQYGRRAHRHARCSCLTVRHTTAQCADVSLTESAASNQYERRAHRHAQTCKPTTSAGPPLFAATAPTARTTTPPL